MEQIFLTAAVLLLPMLCTTAGAAGVFLLRKTGEPATRRMLCGMAAGIMLAASVWSLLLPAIERAEQWPLPAWVPPAVGLLLGAVGLLRLETLAGRLLNAGPGRSGRMVLAVTLHNLPEGMVVGLAAAGRTGCHQRGTGPCAGHRVAEHSRGSCGQPAAGAGGQV